MEHFAQTTDLYTTLFAELKKLGVKVPKTKKFKSGIPREEKCISPSETKMFGVSLSKQEWSCDSGTPLPKFLAAVTAYLLKYSKTVGLFRLSGSIKRQKNLRAKLESGDALEGSEPNDVASLLKQWLRELPEPLIPRCMHDLFIRCQQVESKENRIAATLLACLLLPPENLYALKHLVCFLQKFAANSYENKMGPHNLALIMSPNIFVSRIELMDKNCKSMVQVHTSVIELLIENCEKVGEIPPSVSFHSAIQERSSSDSDFSADVLGFESLKLSKKRRNGPVHDLFCGIRKLVGQNAALSKIQEKSTALVSRSAFKRKVHPEQNLLANKKRAMLLESDDGTLPKTEEIRNILYSDSKTDDVRKMSFGLLRRKEMKRNNFKKSSQASIVLSSQQNYNGDTGQDLKAQVSTMPVVSEETKSFFFAPKLKSESKSKSKSDYNVTLIGKELYEMSVLTSAPQNCLQDSSRSASLCWLQSDTHAEAKVPSLTQDCKESKTHISKDTVGKVSQKSCRQGSIRRGKPNSVKSGLPCQILNEQSHSRSTIKSSKPIQEEAVSKSKKSLLRKTSTNKEIKKKGERYSSMQSTESSKHPKKVSVSQANVNDQVFAKPFNFDSIISLSPKNISVMQTKINGVKSTTTTEKCTENLHLLRPEKVRNNSSSKIPRLKQSFEIMRRNSFSEISKYDGCKISKSRLSDSISTPFHSKIPVMSKKISVSDFNRRYKTPKENSDQNRNSISLINDMGYLDLNAPEENSFNKRESIALILKNNPGHVQAAIHLYNTLTPSTERKMDKFSSSNRSLSCSSRKKLSNSRKNDRILNVSQSYSLGEEKNRSKSKVKCQKLSPLSFAKISLQVSPPDISRALKEVTNTRFRFDEERNFRSIQIQDENALKKLTHNSCYVDQKHSKLKSNSFCGCKRYKVSKRISRSASSPGCPKPGNRLLRVTSAAAYSNPSFTEETNDQHSFSVYPLTHQRVLKSGSALSLDKLKTDVMIDEWQCEL